MDRDKYAIFAHMTMLVLCIFFTHDPHWIEFHYQDNGTHMTQARVQGGRRLLLASEVEVPSKSFTKGLKTERMLVLCIV
jgi:hypothetical protein